MTIFKACDIRGIYGKDLTEQEAFQIGWAVGTIQKRRGEIVKNKIIVGGDVRTSTPNLKSALTEGLIESEMGVIDIGIVPTPVFYFARRKLKVTGGVMVTASHNPPEFNGMKIILGELPITESEIKEISQLCAEAPPRRSRGAWEQRSGGVKSPLPPCTSAPLLSYCRAGKVSIGQAAVVGDNRQAKGHVEQIDITADYKKFLQDIAAQHNLFPQLTSPQTSLSVVIDCGNGCYSEIAPDIFRDFGYKVTELFCIPDGNFPNRHPNSAVEANLSSLRRKVVSEGAHLGVAFDGDGDRVSFVDDLGRMLASDVAAVIFLNKLLAKEASNVKVVHDAKCSKIVSDTVEKLGGIPLMEKSGHTFIKTRMIKEHALFGAEVSGHFFYRHFGGGDDGLYSALLMAKIISESERQLSELVGDVPTYCTTPDIRVPFGDETVLDKIADSFKNEKVCRLDGVRIEFADGWGLARKSVTEPVLTLRFEAKTKSDLDKVMRRFLSPVPKLSEKVFQHLMIESEEAGRS